MTCQLVCTSMSNIEILQVNTFTDKVYPLRHINVSIASQKQIGETEKH